MTVRVDELSSDVTVEPAAASSGASAPGSQQAEQADDVRALIERMARDALRTRAEAYSD